MITIAKSNAAEREVLFGNAADRAGISNRHPSLRAVSLLGNEERLFS